MNPVRTISIVLIVVGLAFGIGIRVGRNMGDQECAAQKDKQIETLNDTQKQINDEIQAISKGLDQLKGIPNGK